MAKLYHVKTKVIIVQSECFELKKHRVFKVLLTNALQITGIRSKKPSGFELSVGSETFQI